MDAVKIIQKRLDKVKFTFGYMNYNEVGNKFLHVVVEYFYFSDSVVKGQISRSVRVTHAGSLFHLLILVKTIKI